MHPEEIKAKMRMAGTTPSALADSLGLHRSTVTHVIHGYSRSSRVEKAIGKLLGLSPSVIWPNRPAPLNRRRTAAPGRRVAA